MGPEQPRSKVIALALAWKPRSLRPHMSVGSVSLAMRDEYRTNAGPVEAGISVVNVVWLPPIKVPRVTVAPDQVTTWAEKPMFTMHCPPGSDWLICRLLVPVSRAVKKWSPSLLAPSLLLLKSTNRSLSAPVDTERLIGIAKLPWVQAPVRCSTVTPPLAAA
jgi:hypothetical protein